MRKVDVAVAAVVVGATATATLVCMFDLDCLLHEVEVASGIAPAVPPPAAITEADPPPEPAA